MYARERERERCLHHGDSRLTRCEAYVELFNDVSPDSESCLIALRRIEFMHVWKFSGFLCSQSEVWMSREGENEITKKTREREIGWLKTKEKTRERETECERSGGFVMDEPWSDRAARVIARSVVVVWDETLCMLLFPVRECLLLCWFIKVNILLV